MADEMNPSKRRKARRGTYKRYLREEGCEIPRQTESRWSANMNAVNESALDCEDIVHHHMHFEENMAPLDEAGIADFDNESGADSDEEVFYDAHQVLDEWQEQAELRNEVLYDGAPLTKAQSSLLISAYAIRHNLTQSATQDLLTLINEHLPIRSVPTSYYMLRKECMFDLGQEDITYHGYCRECSSYLGSEDMLSCEICGTDTTKTKCVKDGFFFVTISIASQLKLLLETPSVAEKLQANGRGAVNGSLEDIRHGSMYKNLQNGILTADDVTLTFNSDGISPFHSSKASVWPILCTINDLPPKERKKHVLIAGIWFGNGKPEMQNFLKCFVEEFDNLAEEGIRWRNPATGGVVSSKVYAIACASDSVARCQLQGLVQFNGYYGCSWCLHPGRRHNGIKHVYPFQDHPHNSRSKDSFIRNAVQARASGQNCSGVKPHLSPLLLLKHFDIVRGFPVEYMHCVCEGVTEKLFSLWFDSMHHQEEWYIGRSLPAIENKVQTIIPPTEITRLPSSPSARAQWKASEFRCWLLFYSLPLLNGILPLQFLQHLLLLVQGIWLLTKSEVTGNDLATAKSCLQKFVQKMESLYGVTNMSYNVHMLLHLPDTVAAWGPLWTVSCFTFEGYNRKIKSLFHGTQGVAHQIVNNFAIVQGLSKRLDAMNGGSPELAAFFKSLVTGYPLVPSVSKVQAGDGEVLLTGNPTVFQDATEDEINSLRMHFNVPVTGLQITEYSKVIVRGVTYATEVGQRRSRRTDSMVVYGTKRIGRVKRILHVQQELRDRVVLLVQPLLVEDNRIVRDTEIGTIADHILVVSEGPLLPPLVFSASFPFFKCVQIFQDDSHYCCVLPNMVELD